MDEVMNRYISKLELGPVNEYKNMAVIPLFTGIDGPPYLTLKEALEQDLILITELDESGVVGELKVKNQADNPVLLLDGEEIIGAKQNRIINATILVVPGAEIIVPVSCTERGRWAYQSEKFHHSNVIADHRLRRNKSYHVLQSLKYKGNFRSDQRAVWDDINHISCQAQVTSGTDAMKDVYTSMESDMEEYIKAFPYQENQKGLIVQINGVIAGFETISSSEAYKQLHTNLIKSYALEARLNQDKNDNQLENTREFLEKTRKTKQSKHKSVGEGYDHRYIGDSLVGSSLIHKEQVIHSAFFKLD